MENQLQPKTLEAVKDEVAKEFRLPSAISYFKTPADWEDFLENDDIAKADVAKSVDEIATRYAAAQNQQVISDIVELRQAAELLYENIPVNKSLLLSKVGNILLRTKHYQNTDV